MYLYEGYNGSWGIAYSHADVKTNANITWDHTKNIT